MTISNDGTIRQWDAEERKKDMFGSIVMGHFDLRKVKNRQGRKAIPTAVNYDRQGKMIVSGNDDGSVQEKGRFWLRSITFFQLG